jgi:hypothetical protein
MGPCLSKRRNGQDEVQTSRPPPTSSRVPTQQSRDTEPPQSTTISAPAAPRSQPTASQQTTVKASSSPSAGASTSAAAARIQRSSAKASSSQSAAAPPTADRSSPRESESIHTRDSSILAQVSVSTPEGMSPRGPESESEDHRGLPMFVGPDDTPVYPPRLLSRRQKVGSDKIAFGSHHFPECRCEECREKPGAHKKGCRCPKCKPTWYKEHPDRGIILNDKGRQLFKTPCKQGCVCPKCKNISEFSLPNPQPRVGITPTLGGRHRT